MSIGRTLPRLPSRGAPLAGLGHSAYPWYAVREWWVIPRVSAFHAAILISILLSACATTQPDPITIKIPVPTPCITPDQVPVSPEIKPDSELAKLPDGQLVLTLAAERLDLKRYHGEASAVLQACVK